MRSKDNLMIEVMRMDYVKDSFHLREISSDLCL